MPYVVQTAIYPLRFPGPNKTVIGWTAISPSQFLGPNGTVVGWDEKTLFPTLEQAVVTAKMLLDRFYVHETPAWRLVYSHGF